MTDTTNLAPDGPAGPGGIHSFEVADQARAEGLADALAAFGFPLVIAYPHRSGWWVTAVDVGPYPADITGYRALDTAHRQATILARRYGGHPTTRGFNRADKLRTSPPSNAPVVRSNPGARAAVAIIPMAPAPPAHPLALTPDNHRPGTVDPSGLDALPWDQLEHAPAGASLPELVRQLIAAPDEDWDALLWTELMTALVHQGTCYSATPAMMPVLAGLATSTSLPARRRLDLHLALLSVADCATSDLIIDADYTGDVRGAAVAQRSRATAGQVRYRSDDHPHCARCLQFAFRRVGHVGRRVPPTRRHVHRRFQMSRVRPPADLLPLRSAWILVTDRAGK